MARTKNSSDTHEPVAKAATAVFNPVGMVSVHVVTPEGNDYDVKPREPFKIKAEDVDWFFGDWNWAFRQHLCLEADYHPTCGYHDPKPGAKQEPQAVRTVREFEPKPDAEPVAANDEKAEEKVEPEPEAKLEPEPDEGQNPEKE